jgi:murein L,D-transpeptidase YcbB/YkuD
MFPVVRLFPALALVLALVLAVVAAPSAALANPPAELPDHRTGRLIAAWIDRLEAEIEVVEDRMEQPATVISRGYMMRRGSVGPRVGELTARLAELGYLAEADRGDRFTPAVEDAVRAVQRDRGLFVDGVVGPQTIGELNRTPRDSLTALHWTIAQMREIRDALPGEMLIVNVPSSRAMLVRDGHILLDMPAAVGRPTRRTPAMVDRIVNVTLNPRWTVPPTIMREDVLPRLRADGETGISSSTVMLDGETVDPAEVDWSEVTPWQIRIRQSPGNHNALGRFLFALTNDYNIFVHDTNHPSVFQRAHRAVSSGCIRVEEARWLAEYLLARDGRYDLDRLDYRLASMRTQILPLAEPLPVYVTYWTATVEPDRDVVYHQDVYGLTEGFVPTQDLAASGLAD